LIKGFEKEKEKAKEKEKCKDMKTVINQSIITELPPSLLP
jgi:hypothetical protein